MPIAAGTLAIDCGSPISSVAYAADSGLVHQAHAPIEHSSERLIQLVNDCVTDRGTRRRLPLRSLLVINGPGSFTGLRVAMATALGLSQALSTPLHTLPTAVALRQFALDQGLERFHTIIDAYRGFWWVQTWGACATAPETTRRGDASIQAQDPSFDQVQQLVGQDRGRIDRTPTTLRRLRPEEVTALAPFPLVGFGATRLAALAGNGAKATTQLVVEPTALAKSALLAFRPRSQGGRPDDDPEPFYGTAPLQGSDTA